MISNRKLHSDKLYYDICSIRHKYNLRCKHSPIKFIRYTGNLIWYRTTIITTKIKKK